jgi:hypothetical protein
MPSVQCELLCVNGPSLEVRKSPHRPHEQSGRSDERAGSGGNGPAPLITGAAEFPSLCKMTPEGASFVGSRSDQAAGRDAGWSCPTTGSVKTSLFKGCRPYRFLNNDLNPLTIPDSSFGLGVNTASPATANLRTSSSSVIRPAATSRSVTNRIKRGST